MPSSEMVGAFAPVTSACDRCGDIYQGDHTCEQHGTLSVITPVVAPTVMAPLGPSSRLGTREEIEAELDGIATAIRQFHIKHPDQVMRECSAYGARLTELTVLLHRAESGDRQYTRIRTQQVDRFLTEIDRQFKTASRIVEIYRQDIELSR